MVEQIYQRIDFSRDSTATLGWLPDRNIAIFYDKKKRFKVNKP